MWDVFISHASEDKDSIVRPLANKLAQYGVRVWYDEFELKIGDSLISSINKGLTESKYGLIILSPTFFKKDWTEFELKSLLTRDITSGAMLLPIWHDVNQAFIMEKSPFLADKKALTSALGIDALAFEIVKIVRPDIINSFALKMELRKLLPSAKIVRRNIEDLKVSEQVRHSTLPRYLIISAKIIATLLPIGAYETFVKNFAKDVDYDREFVIWNGIACAYIDTAKEYNILLSNEKSSKEILMFLLAVSMGSEDICKVSTLDDDMKVFIANSYKKHISALRLIIDLQ